MPKAEVTEASIALSWTRDCWKETWYIQVRRQLWQEHDRKMEELVWERKLEPGSNNLLQMDKHTTLPSTVYYYSSFLIIFMHSIFCFSPNFFSFLPLEIFSEKSLTTFNHSILFALGLLAEWIWLSKNALAAFAQPSAGNPSQLERVKYFPVGLITAIWTNW